MQNFLSIWILFGFGIVAYLMFRSTLFVVTLGREKKRFVNGVEIIVSDLIPADTKDIFAGLRFFARFYMLFFLVISKKTFSYAECMRHPGPVSGDIDFNDTPEAAQKMSTHRIFRDVHCGEGEHSELVSIFVIFVFLNVLLPLFLIFVTYKRLQRVLLAKTSDSSSKKISFQNAYHFLWADYRAGCSVFILLLLLKDSFLPLSGILFDDGFRQGIFGALVLSLYAYAVVLYKPYRFAYLNKLECSLVVLQMAVLLVAGFSFDRTESAPAATLSPVEKEDRDAFLGRELVDV